jgi:hypothetical protein
MLDSTEKASRNELYTMEKIMTLRNELIQIINKDINEKTME